MRYRKLTPTGDYAFGRNSADFYRDVPEAVAQAANTRLRLWLAEWFADTSDGMPWYESVLGNNTAQGRDLAIRQRVLGTKGVKSITSYLSYYDENTRAYRVDLTVDTAYGPAALSVPLPYGTTSALGGPRA